MRRNILSFLEDYERLRGARAFSHRRGLRIERWSYERVVLAARKLARELEARGIAKGDRVLLRAENSPEWVASFFGCALRGAVVVPLDADSTPSFITDVQRQTEPKLLLHDQQEERIFSGLPSLNLAKLEEEVAHQEATPYQAEEIEAFDLLEIIYTSGTTASPRGVMLTHGNLLANISPLEEEIQKYLRFERLVHPLRFLSSLPLSHVFGQLMSLFVPQLLAGEVFFQNSLNPSEIIETTRRERVSVIVAVPRVLELLRERVERDFEREDRGAAFREKLSRASLWSVPRRWWAFRSVHRRFGLKFWAFISGGATLREETESFWQSMGFAVIQGYGMTETASLISVNHPFKKSHGSIGRTLPGQEVKLSENGEILVRGENVSPGYWTGRDGLLKNAQEGWLSTGDVGEMDEEGNLFFKGRKKETIVTASGLNIYPEDLEAALNRQREVREAVVIAVAGKHGPEPLAVLILRKAEASPEEILKRANSLLAKHQQMRRYFLWQETDFPRTATQKVIKREVAEVVKAKLAAESSSAKPLRPLAEVLNRIKPHEQTQAAASSSLAIDLNMDSLDRVELLSALEERYQIELDEAAFTNATTLGDVEKMVYEHAGVESASPYPFPEWARSFPITWLRPLALYLLVLPLTFIMCWVRVRGRECLKDLSGPVLFISNHVSMVDHALILSALPGRFRRRLAIAMEGEILRDWVHTPVKAGWFTRARWLLEYFLVVALFNVFPLPKKSGFRRSFAYAGEMIDRGQSVLVFPEGSRTEDGHMHSFMTGSGLLAQGLSVPVVPIRIDGLFRLKKERRHFAWPGQVSVTFGEPMHVSDKDNPAQIAGEMERRVQEL